MNLENNQAQSFAVIFNMTSESTEYLITVNSIFNNQAYKQNGIKRDLVYDALETFKSQNLINLVNDEAEPIPVKLTFLAEGNRVKKLPNRYLNFVEELQQKSIEKKQKEQKDEKFKELQLTKLEHDVNTMKAQYSKLIEFQDSGIERNKQQNKQWKITTVIAITALIISIIALIAKLK